jgi:nucleotide-binding universal stress UspA family protein
MKLFPPDTILVPTDLSDTSLDALGFARLFHERFGSRIIVLHAEQLEAPPYFTSAQTEALLDASRHAREQAIDEVQRAVAPRLGFAPETRVVAGVPSETIVSLSDQEGADLVVLGTHGRRGVSRLWLGSVTERVLRTSRCPVLAARNPLARDAVETIYCPVGSGAASAGALRYAASMAESFDARLHVVHFVEEAATQAPNACPGVSDELRKRCRVEEAVIEGSEVNGILEGARTAEADMVVMGAGWKRSRFGEIFSGTTVQVIQRLEAPLLVVPSTE